MHHLVTFLSNISPVVVLYISQLIDIHPHATVQPYNHKSIHLHYFFNTFEPVQMFWTYPFEQLIGQI